MIPEDPFRRIAFVDQDHRPAQITFLILQGLLSQKGGNVRIAAIKTAPIVNARQRLNQQGGASRHLLFLCDTLPRPNATFGKV
ncbi:MAG: hypothetical protein R2682_00520 [Pyrinomonadaceae bacterium]